MSLPPTFVKGFHDPDSVSRMEYRKFGHTNMKVSKLAIGGATISSLYGFEEDEAIKTIHKALKKGINYIDTAPFYGNSEEVYGRALKGIPRQSYYLATKIGRYGRTEFDYSAKRTRESVERSLKLLGVDYIDVLQIHDIEFAPNLDAVLNEALPTIEELVKEGKVRYIGVSAYPVSILKEAISRAPGRFNTVLCYARYSLLDDTLLQYLPFFKEQKLAVICASGHALGLLSNAGPQPWHPVSEDVKDLCRKAAELCKKDGIELGKLAMHYFSQLEDASVFLVGMQRENLLDFNLSAVMDGLNEKEKKMLKYLKDNVFTKSVNWEGVELKLFEAELKKK